jgi:hypothetical protein
VIVASFDGFDPGGLLFAALVIVAYNLWRHRHNRRRPG